MDNYITGLRKLPQYMHGGVIAYIETGREPGGFLLALFSNDLKGSFGHADHVNAQFMREWVEYMYNYMPGASQGSPEIVECWMQMGGLHGRESTPTHLQANPDLY